MTEAYEASGSADRGPRAYDPFEKWPEPDARLLNGGPRPAPDFMTRPDEGRLSPLECFGSLGPWLVDLAASKGAPVDYVAVPFLAFAAGVVGAGRAIELRPGWVEYPTLWVASVGNPSSGKSPALEVLKRAARTLEREEASDMDAKRGEFEARKIEAEYLREKWEANAKEAAKHDRAAPPMPEEARDPEEPLPPRIMVADATTEKLAHLIAANQRGLISVRDELAGLLGNFGKYGGSDEPFYLSAYSGDFSPVDRQKGGTINAERACLSLVGGIQPDKFQALLYGRANDGLVARFLPVWPDLKPKKWKVPTADEGRALTIMRRLRSLKMEPDEAGVLGPRCLQFTPEAERVFAAWYEAHDLQVAASGGFMAEFLGKSNGRCARLALVLELIEWAAGVNGPADGPAAVSALSVMRAATLCTDYFEPMAKRCYADAALPDAERKAVAFLRELRTQRTEDGRPLRTFNARTAQREWGVPGVSTAEDMAAVCAVLLDGDCIRTIEARAGDTGRKQKAFAVNPRLFRKEAVR